jgi:pyrrolidone-carboxylate peptidase
MRCLITGFEPIFGIKRTPSGSLAKIWSDGSISVPGVEVRSIVLRQIYEIAATDTCTEIVGFKPHIVIMYGATQHNDPIRFERFAINIRNTTMGDNNKIPIRDTPIVLGGQPAYESSWPCQILADQLSKEGSRAIVSYHAGTHVCNDQLYLVMKWLNENDIGHPVAAGFLHISFPNEFGVVEDENWETAGFTRIIDSSMKLVRIVSDWYISKYGNRK